jgi:hypothetical protein
MEGTRDTPQRKRGEDTQLGTGASFGANQTTAPRPFKRIRKNKYLKTIYDNFMER